MRSSFIKSCLLALATASTVVAQTAGFDVFTAPSTPGSVIPAGSTYTIKWTPSSSPTGTISLVLLQGPSNTSLQLGDKIASGIDSATGSYDWPVPTTLPNFPYYGIKLQLDSDTTIFQYSTYFSITGLSTGTDSTTTASSSTTMTVQVSQVGPVTSASTTTISASFITVSNTTSSAASTTSSISPSSNVTTTSAGGATSTSSSTSSAASASKSSGAVSHVVGGTGLLGALLMSLGMLL